MTHPSINFNFNFSVDSNNNGSNNTTPAANRQNNRDRNFANFLDTVLAGSTDGVRIQFHDLSAAAGLAGLSSSMDDSNSRGLPFEQIYSHTSISVVEENSQDIC